MDESNDLSQSGQGDMSHDNSLTQKSKLGRSKDQNTKGTPRTKRRSKNDSQGRTHKCNQWDKSYLSYPALYTHRKQKHNNNDAETPRQSVASNRKGRPPKVEKINPSTESYFTMDDKKPGENPADFLVNYQEALNEFKINKLSLDSKMFSMQLDTSSNPLFQVLRIINEKGDNYFEGKEDVKIWDDAFAIYLKYCSEKVNANFFKTICKFIIIYREAFNQYGHDKYFSMDSEKKWEKEYYGTLHKRFPNKSFSEHVNPEYVPDVANEVYVFFQFHYLKLGVTKDQMKELTLNFTTWLSNNDMTFAKVFL